MRILVILVGGFLTLTLAVAAYGGSESNSASSTIIALADQVQEQESRIAALEALRPSPTHTNQDAVSATITVLSREIELLVQARDTEYQTIQAAVFSMMSDNALSSLPNNVTTVGGINDMYLFPDNSAIGIDKVTDPDGNVFSPFARPGYVLFAHAKTGGVSGEVVNYVALETTMFFYVSSGDGTITQYTVNGVKTNP